jgi:acetolactate synthase-1/2/3 large subunit
MDIVSMTRHITKLSVTPLSTIDFPEIVSRAYNMAMLGRKGGVVIDFPYNIQKMEVEL